ncbi:TspO/MBR related protein [Enteractinococcus coprophilus]|uniref:TspO/MBR related protein n=2 Tax=Enteractinococcus coprophilus TaxID=1027633 RepID=A0A543AP95_9MICC|nr:TspO/MBR related protein [Enteractinococcus coprophilus]
MEQKANSRFMPILTVLAVVVAIGLSFIGSGAVGGTPINEAADGALSADATPFAPAGPAFSIWSVIYAGLFGYAIYQLLPAQRAGSRHAARHAQLRPWAALSALLNAAWIGVVQADSVGGSVLVIVVLLLVLIRILMILRKTRTHTKTDALLTDGTFGLYLGWVAVATTANIAAWVSTFGVDKFTGWEWAAVAIIAVVMLIGLGLAVYSRGRIAPALAISWGVTWLAIARMEGQYESPIIVWAAFIAAAVVLVATVIIRLTTERKSARTSW